MPRRLFTLLCCLLATAVAAQRESDRQPGAGQPSQAGPLEPEPISPREALFLAIELRDLEAAREALADGGEEEISLGDPSPLATAALHNDLRMVLLLLDSGGDPSATGDSPLEEAVRHENVRMAELLMRAGARVPPEEAGRQLFSLAQRGGEAAALSKILLDHGGSADLCLAAAVGHERIELIDYCLERGADVSTVPADLNVLSVALRGGQQQTVDRVLAAGLVRGVLAGALDDAIAAGREDVVRMSIDSGAMPAFAQVELAVESGQPEICLSLLEQSPEEADVLADGDVEALIQRASDLGFGGVSTALRRKAGLPAWDFEKILGPAAAGLLALGLIALLVINLRRGSASAVDVGSVAGPMDAPAARSPAVAPPAAVGPAGLPTGGGPVQAGVAASAAAPVPRAPEAQVPAAPMARGPSPAATVRIDPGQLVDPMSVAMPPAVPTSPAAHVAAVAAAVGAAEQPVAVVDEPGWEIVPEPVTPAAAKALDVELVPQAPPPAQADLRMPDVDLTRDAQAVFAAARQAAAGDTVRPDAPDRRQIVLVTPARVTMLQSCPAAGTLSAEATAAAEEIVPAAEARNVAVIAFNDLDAEGGDAARAIPFFELLRRLGSLGHAVWIFEGHVSAMTAGCQEADTLIVDDGMMPYLPGNWRSVATRVMRGSDIFVYERKNDSLRKLA
ncbi:MAG: hypothetical protein GY719_22280 [bacterium]|nr:hypothetical protein [bacterium]